LTHRRTGSFKRRPAARSLIAIAGIAARCCIHAREGARSTCCWAPPPLLYWLYRQPLEPKETRVEPASREEMELQLASGGEAG
jgi:hypothetical protein